MMSRMILYFLTIVGIGLPLLSGAQIIHGEIYDVADKSTLTDVNVENIYTGLSVACGSNGSFVIAAAKGELLEFKKSGYKTARARIPMGYVPSYFKIGMQKGFHTETSKPNKDSRYNYKDDSLKMHEMYKPELDFAKMSAIDMLASPFSAMSGKNREVWRFQDDYAASENDKYVDRTFNAELVSRLTHLQGDSLKYFMKRYRPSYDQLREMSDYTFFNFIKQTAKTYRHPNTPRIAN
jgi:hypothetical protein